eukprot:SM000001S04476  [mRNA]  locus=s1:439796:445141:+ [translate_table: standard]
MDDELRQLQALFSAAQEARSSVRLSERNIVELVNKLRELKLLEDSLLHTLNGKEYITRERLRSEVEHEIRRCRRVTTVDLAASLGVDLFYCERECQELAAHDPTITIVQGEVLTTGYWDDVAEEVEETLQEAGRLSIADLARRFAVGAELLGSIIADRLGKIIRGKLEGGQLYTPAHLARVKAMVRGALRATTVACPVSVLWSLLHQLQADSAPAGMTEGVSASLYQTTLAEVVKEGAALGTMRAGGASWTPAVFARIQAEAVDSFFSQNGYIDYQVLRKLGVAQPKQHLQATYSDGVALDTVFVHPSIISQLDAAIEEVVIQSTWCDAAPLLPSSFSVADMARIIKMCPSLQNAQKDGKPAVLLAETCIVSEAFIRELLERLSKEVKASAKASMGLKGKALPVHGRQQKAVEASANDDMMEDGEALRVGKEAKKGRRGGARVALEEDEESEGPGKRSSARDKRRGSSKSSSKKEVTGKVLRGAVDQGDGGIQDEGVPGIPEMAAKLVEWYPDLEDEADVPAESGALALALAAKLRPFVVQALAEAKRAAFTVGAEERRKRKDAVQLKLGEVWNLVKALHRCILHGQLLLYSKALDLFEDDPSTLAILTRHLLRSTATSEADLLIQHLELEQRIEDGEAEPLDQDVDLDSPLSQARRMEMAKNLPADIGRLALSLVDALEGKSVADFETAVELCVQESGMLIKKLDKKAEKALLFAHKKQLEQQLEAGDDPVGALPLAVSLLFAKIYHRALQAPGRAIAATITRLKPDLREAAHRTLLEYHVSTVEYLQASSGGRSGEAEERMQSLQAKLPDLKVMLSAPLTGAGSESK